MTKHRGGRTDDSARRVRGRSTSAAGEHERPAARFGRSDGSLDALPAEAGGGVGQDSEPSRPPGLSREGATTRVPLIPAIGATAGIDTAPGPSSSRCPVEGLSCGDRAAGFPGGRAAGRRLPRRQPSLVDPRAPTVRTCCWQGSPRGHTTWRGGQDPQPCRPALEATSCEQLPFVRCRSRLHRLLLTAPAMRCMEVRA